MRMIHGILIGVFCLFQLLLSAEDKPLPEVDRRAEVKALDRARSLEKAGQFLAAAGEYDHAIRARPDDVYHYLSCARMYDRAERPDLGLKVMREALLNFPQNPRVNSGLARMEFRMGQFESALLHVQSALSNPDGKEADYLQSLNGQILRELKRFGESEKAFLASLRIKEDAWVFYEYGKLLMDRKDFPRAVWAFQKARSFGVRLEPRAKEILERKYAAALYEDGIRLIEKGEKSQAKARLSSILKLRPEWVSVYAEKARFWLKRL